MTKPHSKTALMMLAGLLGGAAVALATPARAGEGVPPPAAAKRAAPAPQKPPRSSGLSTNARQHFRAAWGVDAMRVSRVASGSLIRFNYHVTDPVQAAPLADKNATPVLHAPRAHATLSVPVMDKVGALRQTGALKAGQEYWVTFSNKGNLVKAGDRVDVVIGRFHADGLPVE